MKRLRNIHPDYLGLKRRVIALKKELEELSASSETNVTDLQDQIDSLDVRITAIEDAGYPAGTKVYKAIVSQGGTAAPNVVELLQNTYNSAMEWFYGGVGDYYMHSIGAEMIVGKTIINGGMRDTNAIVKYGVGVSDAEWLNIQVLDNTLELPANGVLLLKYIEIITFP